MKITEEERERRREAGRKRGLDNKGKKRARRGTKNRPPSAEELKEKAEQHSEPFEPDEAPISPGMYMKPVCGMPLKGNRGTCKNTPGKGTSHPGYGRCYKHEGKSGRDLAGIAAAVGGESVLYDRPIMGTPIMVPPGQALLRCVYMIAGEVQYMTEKIHALPSPFVQEEVRDGDGQLVTRDTERFHPWISARQKSIDRLARISTMAVNANVMAREVAVQETLAEIAAVFTSQVMDRLGLTEEQREALPEAVEQALLTAPGSNLGPKRNGTYGRYKP